MKAESVQNPFAAKVEPAAPAVRWGIAASAPPVDPSEIETTQRAAEVVIMWGDEVLHVSHVSPPRDVTIGEGQGTDYLVGREVLGAERVPVVVERGGQLFCVIPEGASGQVSAGGSARSFDELAGEGKLEAFEGGARLYAVPEGATARVEHRGLSFVVRPTNAARAVGGQQSFRLRHTGWIGLSLAVHAVFLVMFYFMPPHSSAMSIDDTATRDRLIQYMTEANAVEEPPLPELTQDSGQESAGREGERHDGEEGASGDPDQRPSHGRYGVQGRPDDPNPEMARERIRNDMQSIAAIGAVRSLVGSWDTPTSPYGADQAHGLDAMNAIGALMGDQIAGNNGALGLGMHGTGRGAGGFGLGTLGVGRLGTMGTYGQGCEPGQECRGGYGHGVSSLGGRRAPAGPTVRPAPATVMGGLSQEAIRRVVHRHLPEVRFCYEQGLQQNPSLEGRVTANWIIAGDGHVQSSSIAASTLSNNAVESCIASAVRRWTFPTPENRGVVGVNYPFVLQSND